MLTTLLTALSVCALTFLFCQALFKKKIDEQAVLVKETTEKLRELEQNKTYIIEKEVHDRTNAYRETIKQLEMDKITIKHESYQLGVKDTEEQFKNEYVVQVLPYINKVNEKRDGFFSFGTEEIIEIGYQYQLFIKGFPALEKAQIIIDRHRSKDYKVNHENINQLIATTIGATLENSGGIIRFVTKKSS
ncbi:hypothetical protein [Flavobacterium stagni]|uniref:Uncharacterized protein n=1 Tax=Flavobacterium stagni TaxID=2506421 RepID=A0A4Q1K3D5_9FLAO|nr:hypothetical protein [Flavobacterium stagni]RXR20198.1 hypothetical protein EQG61_13185 [Flavobacterium stagni]